MGRMNKSKQAKKTICGMTEKERSAIIKEIANLSKDCGEDLILIGEGDEANALAAAIIGYDSNTYKVCYDYDKLVEAMSEYNGWSVEETIEWIDYNTMRSIDYLDGRTAPRIINKFNT